MASVRPKEQWSFRGLRTGLRGLAGLALGLAVILIGAGRPALAGTEMPYGQGLLWQIDGAGPEPSYLFGTMHSADEEVTDLAAPVLDALERAQSLSLEVIMTPEAQMSLAFAGMLSDGRTLEQVVGPDLFRRAVESGRPYGIGQAQLQLLKPWSAMVLFSLPPSEIKRQAAGKKALDHRLQEVATERGLALHGLEEIDEQIAMFSDLTESDQVAMLDATLSQSDQVELNFEKMRDAYLDRNPGGIFEMLQAQQTEFDPALAEAFSERLLDDRNDRMVERMQPRLAEGGAFVAVGALHLPGEGGILKLLEGHGYQLTRLY